MKKLRLITSLLLAAMLFLTSFKQDDTGIIKGSITPIDAAQHVLAISAKDTLQMSINNGNFQFNDLKIGNYTIIIVARSPYRDYVAEDVVVSNGSFNDLGQITLEQ